MSAVRVYGSLEIPRAVASSIVLENIRIYQSCNEIESDSVSMLSTVSEVKKAASTYLHVE